MNAIPSVFFNTTIEGITPINPIAKNRIGIIGKFDRGVINQPTYALGDEDVKKRYNLDNNPGSLVYKSARAQGATEFALVRVLGRQKQACSAVLFNGIVSVNNNLNFDLIQLSDIETIKVANNGEKLFNLVNNYTGFDQGYVYIYIDSIDTDNSTFKDITLKYLFKTKIQAESLNENEIDWSLVTDTIVVDSLNQTNVDILGLNLGINSTSNIAAEDIYKIEVYQNTWQVALKVNELPNQIANNIVSKISGLEPFGEIKLTQAQDGVIFCFSEIISGTKGNNFIFKILPDVTDNNLKINNTNLISINEGGLPLDVTFTGGLDGPRNAYRDFYTINNIPLLRVLAKSPGDWGNNLKVSIYPISLEEFKLTVSDTSLSTFEDNSETFILNFKDLDYEGYLNKLKNSKFIEGIYLPQFNNSSQKELYKNYSPSRIAISDNNIIDINNPSHINYYGFQFLNEISLLKGYDGPVIDDTDYILGIKSLESFPVHIILTDGYSNLNINNTLISHCENATELEGLRISLIAAPKFLQPIAAKKFVTGLNSKRAMGVVGWKTLSSVPNAERFSVPATADLAGILSIYPFYLSPAARGIISPVQEVSEIDIAKFTNTLSLNIYSENQLEILALDPALLSYHFTTGNTLSSDPNWQKINSVRTFDYIRQDVFRLLQRFKSRPNTAQLKSQIAGSIDAYLEGLFGAGQIAGYRPTEINELNNTQTDYLNRKVNIKISILELYAADYIYANLIKDTSISEGFVEG